VLSESLKFAVRQGYLGRNPCDMVDAPSAKKNAMRTMTPGEVGHLLDIAMSRPYYPVTYTAISTGLRQAELPGLRWRDIAPSVLSHAFNRLVKEAGLSGVRFHDCRHTFASLMLMRGAKIKVISEALGHASAAFTMDTYSHIMEGMQKDAVALLDEVLAAGVSASNNAELARLSAN
jgi:integrase